MSVLNILQYKHVILNILQFKHVILNILQLKHKCTKHSTVKT
jgi:hypothetical protein